MERKKRRRSIRNLRRQSISSFGDDNDATLANDTLMMSLNDQGEVDDIFGTVWVESNEESLKEKRKKRRSSVLFQKPLLKIDSCSPVEIMRHEIPVNSPVYPSISPELIKFDGKSSPLLVTPSNSFTSVNNLDMAFVGELTTPIIAELNTSAKKVYPVTPDVDFDILDSPLQDVYTPSLTPITSGSLTATTPDLDTEVNSQYTETTPVNSSATETNLNDDTTVDPMLDTPKNGLDESPDPRAILEDNSENKENEDQRNGFNISPTLVESLDSLASGAMGLFNSIVRRISKGTTGKPKTPKKPKKETISEKTYSDSYIEGFLIDTKARIEEKKCEELFLGRDNLEYSVNEEKKLEEILEGDEILDENMEVIEEELNQGVIETEEEPLPLDDELNCNTLLLKQLEDVPLDTAPSENVDKLIADTAIDDNFSMKSLVESIDNNTVTNVTKRRSKRKSADFSSELNASLDESCTTTDESGLRKSRRNRRKSLEIYQAGVAHENEHPEWYLPSERFRPQEDENLEELYLNKNYMAPLEKTWETIYESPNKSKQFVSKKKLRRVIDFQGFQPTKFKRRLQKAHKNGWTNICSRELSDDFVQCKLSHLYSYLDNSTDSS
ncbi:hypothetical protein LOTGIDRAFT_228402 [Lottia gigantea]|uniref:Tantalus-like domain-containing protein n=1 Tax=Lottia gigantea TaxID=225164 RepID=V4C840_LOTGI|nr:hypothetical protein LOTGIDRAFT_228402 [Lottia gigantea]ESO97864.1 hypothetical protein LOTGIDRAFT_228402 [Lottia gigantea]